MKYLHIKFNNFFEYQTMLNILNNRNFNPKHPNPDELKLSFSYLYSYEGIIEHLENLCEPLNIKFVTEGYNEIYTIPIQQYL